MIKFSFKDLWGGIRRAPAPRVQRAAWCVIVSKTKV